MVPNSVDAKRLILQAMHDHPLAGPLGVSKTLKAISSSVVWQRAAQDLIASTFDTVLAVNSTPLTPLTGLLQLLIVPPSPWHTITTDYITGLPLTPDGRDTIAVFVAKLTKYACAVPSDGVKMYVLLVVQHEDLSPVIDFRAGILCSPTPSTSNLLGIRWSCKAS